MSSPIFLPRAAAPCDAVLEKEAELLRRDGMYHCGALYFASAADAAIARRVEAERIVREQERHEALTCAFCFEKIGGHVAVIIAQRPVHPDCAKEFDAWVASKPAENDPRWSAVTVSTPVEFDGVATTYGQLSQNERQSCEFTPDGALVGGYPL